MIGYEVMPVIRDDTQEATLSASFTPNNGIRIQIINNDIGPAWSVFDLGDEQAEALGRALIRWVESRRMNNP